MLITKCNSPTTVTHNTLKEEFSEHPLDFQQLLVTLLLLGVIVCAIVVGIRYAQAADPYVQEVLAVPGEEQRGQEIFQMNCAVCHGLEGKGAVGPSLLGVSSRKSKSNLIKQVVSGKTPPMPQFQPKPQDMADLLQYLETL